MHTHKIVTIWGDGYVNLTVAIFYNVYQIITLYML